MNIKQWEGAVTLPVSITITKELLTAYAAATGPNHAATEELHYVPPALPMIFYQYMNVPWLDGQSFIHKEQTFVYDYPISIGDSLQCTVSLNLIEKRRQFLVLHQELIGKNEQNQRVFSAKSILLKETE
jgi:N-terminal half of MaoC dehydratase